MHCGLLEVTCRGQKNILVYNEIRNQENRIMYDNVLECERSVP